MLLGKEFVPPEDRAGFMTVVESPEGSTLAYTDKYLKQIETIFHQPPEVKSVFSAIGLAWGALDSGDAAVGSLLDGPVIDELVLAVAGDHFLKDQSAILKDLHFCDPRNPDQRERKNARVPAAASSKTTKNSG